MRKSIYIIGAGGMAIETFSIFEANRLSYYVKGFLEEDCTREGKTILGKPISDVKYILEDSGLPESEVVCAIGSTKRKRLITELKRKGIKFIKAIHPTAVISPHCEIGNGTIVAPFVVVNPLVKVGSHIILNYSATIGHGSVIGDYSTISPGARISGNVKIGERAFVGNNASINEGISIGNGAVIGAGSVVTQNVPDLALVVGAPASIKKVYDNFEARPW